ncbi:hypothetical protein LX32DRAFT_245193 [Colletotrichum zoysiae]|uniref:Uncharacterized protein n=1 Tax=Colletotrichum zoysiae TaxID=1216348 RepID=A0AAD9HMP6_9PEZI|nr:hypothetical protein LX32DRAFT_245193 [Colletotrichum zoysiae]
MDPYDTMSDNDLRSLKPLEQNCVLCEWPPGADGDNATGIECMMALIRLINGRLSYDQRDPSLPERSHEEGQNPLMRQAWQGTEYLAQEWTLRDKTDLVETIGFPDVRSATFENIVALPFMNSTLWARPDHHLSERFTAKPGSFEWELVEDERDDVRAERSLVRIQRQPGSGPPDITAEIQRLFDDIEILSDDSGQTFVAKPPRYVRVLYTPCADDVDHTLDSLQVIHVRDIGEEEDPIDDGVDRQLWRYVLKAAVRLRDRPDGHDKIRLFTASGADIAPTFKYHYTDADWQVGAPGHSYFLLYGRSDVPLKRLSHEERMEICSDARYYRMRATGWEVGSKVEEAMEMLNNVLPESYPDHHNIGRNLLAPRPWEVPPSRPPTSAAMHTGQSPDLGANSMSLPSLQGLPPQPSSGGPGRDQTHRGGRGSGNGNGAPSSAPSTRNRDQRYTSSPPAPPRKKRRKVAR